MHTVNHLKKRISFLNPLSLSVLSLPSWKLQICMASFLSLQVYTSAEYIKENWESYDKITKDINILIFKEAQLGLTHSKIQVELDW